MKNFDKLKYMHAGKPKKESRSSGSSKGTSKGRNIKAEAREPEVAHDP